MIGRLIGVGVAACLSCGCSFLFVTKPPANLERLPPSAPVECTTSRAAPLIDTAIAAFQVYRTATALNAKEWDYRDAPISRDADIGFGVGLTALFAVSAVYGLAMTARCDVAKEEHGRAEADVERGESHRGAAPTFTDVPRPVEPAPPVAPTPAAPPPATPVAPTPTPSMPGKPGPDRWGGRL